MATTAEQWKEAAKIMATDGNQLLKKMAELIGEDYASLMCFEFIANRGLYATKFGPELLYSTRLEAEILIRIAYEKLPVNDPEMNTAIDAIKTYVMADPEMIEIVQSIESAREKWKTGKI